MTPGHCIQCKKPMADVPPMSQYNSYPPPTCSPECKLKRQAMLDKEALLRKVGGGWCPKCKKTIQLVLYTDPLRCGNALKDGSTCRQQFGVMGDPYLHILTEPPP